MTYKILTNRLYFFKLNDAINKRSIYRTHWWQFILPIITRKWAPDTLRFLSLILSMKFFAEIVLRHLTPLKQILSDMRYKYDHEKYFDKSMSKFNCKNKRSKRSLNNGIETRTILKERYFSGKFARQVQMMNE